MCTVSSGFDLLSWVYVWDMLAIQSLASLPFILNLFSNFFGNPSTAIAVRTHSTAGLNMCLEI